MADTKASETKAVPTQNPGRSTETVAAPTANLAEKVGGDSPAPPTKPAEGAAQGPGPTVTSNGPLQPATAKLTATPTAPPAKPTPQFVAPKTLAEANLVIEGLRKRVAELEGEAKADGPDGGGLKFSGRVGQAFGIEPAGDEDFGDSGTLTVSGQAVFPTKWSSKQIKGTLPSFVQPGDVVVTRSPDGTRFSGKYVG